MKRSFRDRFYTPQVARAITGPRAILAFGIVTAGTILVGVPILGAFALGAIGYAVTVGLAIPRNPTQPAIDAAALSAPWNGYVAEVVDSVVQFKGIVASMESGPLRERLDDMAAKMEDGEQEAWRIAKIGERTSAALASLNPDRVNADLVAAQQRLQWEAQNNGESNATKEQVAALQSQASTIERLQRVIDDAQSRLRVLDARFDELVARGTEVSLGNGDPSMLGNDVNELVSELEAVRRAIDEVSTAATPTG